MLTSRSFAKKVAVGSLLLAFSFQAAAAPVLSHEKIACIPPGGSSKLSVNVATDGGLSSVRAYFRAEQYKDDYYLESRRGEGNSYWVVLPLPKNETKNVVYRFVVVDGDGKEFKTDSYTVPVSSPCSIPLSSEEKAYGDNLVIGLADMSQPVVPEGFKCDGVIGKITVEGVLMPHDECRLVLAALVPIFPPGVFLMVGAAAAIGGGIIVSQSGGGDTTPVSPSRPAANTSPAPK